MISIEKVPKTYRARPAGWYASCWMRNAVYVYRTKREAVAKARELHTKTHGHIVNVDWIANGQRLLVESIGRASTIVDCRDGEPRLVHSRARAGA